MKPMYLDLTPRAEQLPCSWGDGLLGRPEHRGALGGVCAVAVSIGIDSALVWAMAALALGTGGAGGGSPPPGRQAVAP